MPNKKSRVSGGSKAQTGSGEGAAFHKDVQQPKKDADAAEFDPTRPGTFDLPGFISGARTHVNTRVVPITSRPDVAGELSALTFERDKIVELIEEDKATEGGTPKRLSAKSQRSQRLDEVKARIAELEPQLEGTYVLVKVSPADPNQEDEVARTRTKGIDRASEVFHRVARIRSEDSDEDAWSQMSPEQWAEFFEVIGIEQYSTLDQTFSSITYQGVTPDFYERYSASRATRSTSSS